MEITAKTLMDFMEEWAPQSLAERWDHPGLQAGDPARPVRKVLVSLDLTKENARYAAENGVDMVISHHPFLFRALQKVDLSTEKGKILALCLSRGICAFAAHTNLDTAAGGVNDALADVLELKNRRGLVPIHEKRLFKFIVFVPALQEDEVRRAIADAGAGSLGAYSRCSFSSRGIGRFLPGVDAHPFLGKPLEEETAEEVRIEAVVREEKISAVLSAMRAAHPYEEPAYDLYPMACGGVWDMMGRVGELPREMAGLEAVDYIKEKLGLPVAKFAGNPDRRVKTVAVLGGAGVEFASMAAKAGADLYLTGDVKYHEAQDAAAEGLLVVDGGHYYTERVVVPVIAKRLREAAEKHGWEITVIEDPVGKDIFEYR